MSDSILKYQKSELEAFELARLGKMKGQSLQKFVRFINFKLAFPDDSSYSASRVFSIAHDAVKPLSSKDKYAESGLPHFWLKEFAADDDDP